MSEKNKDIQNRSKRIASNTLVLFARMLIITFVNLYTVRWVLAGLGTEDYGIFNAVAGVVTASTCISSVLALSTQRFYSFAMGKGESDRLKEIFSVSLNIVVLIALVLLVLFEIVGHMVDIYTTHHSCGTYGSGTMDSSVFPVFFHIHPPADTIHRCSLCQ